MVEILSRADIEGILPSGHIDRIAQNIRKEFLATGMIVSEEDAVKMVVLGVKAALLGFPVSLESIISICTKSELKMQNHIDQLFIAQPMSEKTEKKSNAS